MFDLIVDKVMVVIVLVVIVSVGGMDLWIVLFIVIILFCEVFVFGLCEFFGDIVGMFKVIKLVKWKMIV